MDSLFSEVSGLSITIHACGRLFHKPYRPERNSEPDPTIWYPGLLFESDAIWTHVVPRHDVESIGRNVRLLSTGRPRVFHYRAQSNSRDLPRVDEYLVQLRHSPDVCGTAAERCDVRAVWEHDEYGRPHVGY